MLRLPKISGSSIVYNISVFIKGNSVRKFCSFYFVSVNILNLPGFLQSRFELIWRQILVSLSSAYNAIFVFTSVLAPSLDNRYRL